MLRIAEIYTPREAFRLVSRQWRDAHDHTVVRIGRMLWKVPGTSPRAGLFKNVVEVDMSGACTCPLRTACDASASYVVVELRACARAIDSSREGRTRET